MVTRVLLSGDTNGLNEMELDVRCQSSDVAAVAQWIRSKT
jgi:hypothetical protein